MSGRAAPSRRGIEKAPTGVAGLDQVTGGGVPRGRTTLVLLDHRVAEEVSTRRLRVVKYRGSGHGTNEYPFLLDDHGFTVLPLTALGLDRLIDHLKADGVTGVFTAPRPPQVEPDDGSLLVSTLIDTWVSLRGREHGDERSRELVVGKSRGTAHSRRVHRFEIGDRGVVVEGAAEGAAGWRRVPLERAEPSSVVLAEEPR